MERIAYLAPRHEMLEIAQMISSETGMSVHMEAVNNDTAVERARAVVAEGAEVIIARGYQAYLISREMDVPLVEVRLTGQEMGMLVMRSKLIAGVPHPTIGIVGHARMFCDMSYFDHIYDVRIKEYFFDQSYSQNRSLEEQVLKAIEDGVDIIIGGDIAQSHAQKYGMKSLFLSSTDDSIRVAFRQARSLLYASDLEKKNTAEMRALLDYSFNAIVRVNEKGDILLINHPAEQLFGWEAHKVAGRNLAKVTESVTPQMLEMVLGEGKEIYSTFLRINNTSFVANFAPVLAGEQITGAIFSCQEVKQLEEMGAAARREMYRQGHVARYSFDDLPGKSPLMKELIALAKLYAQSDAPVILHGETGCDQPVIAQCIHNEGLRKNGPFVLAECSSTGPVSITPDIPSDGDEHVESQRDPYTELAIKAHGGTLFFSNVDRLSLDNQYRLLHLITDKLIPSQRERGSIPLDVRIIASSDADLLLMTQQGMFHQELYYTLNTLGLALPPLRDRPEDIDYYVSEYVKEYVKKYDRYVVLTKGAKAYLRGYLWKGNQLQLRSFCERLVLTAPHRSVSETFVEQVLYQMYPIVFDPQPSQKVVYKDPEAAMIAGLLEKHGGRRKDVAEEMKISTSTLWRKMKKHRITGKFEV